MESLIILLLLYVQYEEYCLSYSRFFKISTPLGDTFFFLAAFTENAHTVIMYFEM